MKTDHPEVIRRTIHGFTECNIPRRGKTALTVRQAGRIDDPRRPGTDALFLRIGGRNDLVDRRHVELLADILKTWLDTGEF
jgi:hypothetical protein